MLIVCDSCGAEYEIDVDEDDLAAQPQRGLRFRCSACGYTFSVGGDGQISGADSLVSEPGADSSLPAESPPMLLKQEGKVYQVDDAATLQRWIVERRVLREDLLSIGGLKWEPVGTRRDLQVFFQLVEHAEQAAVASQGSPRPPVDEGSGAHSLQGHVPWETGIDAPLPAHGPDPGESRSLPFAAPEADSEELADDDGTDAGLPLGDFLPDSVLPQQGDGDADPMEAGQEPPLAAAVPNLAQAGPAQADPAPEPETVPAAPEPPTEASEPEPPTLPDEPSVSQDLLFPGERREPAVDFVPSVSDSAGFDSPVLDASTLDDDPDLGRRDRAPSGWILGAAAVIIFLGLLWWGTRSPEPAPVPAPQGPTTSAPAAEQPAAEQPAAEKPAAEEPAAEQPPSEQPAAEEPPTEQPAAEEPPIEQPAAEEPPIEQPAAEAPPSGEPVAEQPPQQTARTAVASPPLAEEPTAHAPPPSAAPTPVEPAAASTARSGQTLTQLIEAGWTAVEAGRYADARASFDQARKKSPGDSDAIFGLGYAYEKLDNLPAAQRYYCQVAASGRGEPKIEAEGRIRALSLSCE